MGREREKETLLKARITTLEMYLKDVFVLLRDVEQIRGKANTKLIAFGKDLEYQDQTAIELEE